VLRLTGQRGRPKGALGQPRRADLELLWLICDLRESGEISFSKALHELRETLHEFVDAFGVDLREFVEAPGLDFPGARAIWEDIWANGDPSSLRKRLQRLARRYPRDALLAALRGSQPTSSNAFGLPADALCSGPSWEI
jgi:hypothetical protein